MKTLVKNLQRLWSRQYHQLDRSTAKNELRIPQFMQRNPAPEQESKDDKLRRTLSELEETQRQLRVTQLSGYNLYQEFKRVRKKHRTRRRQVLLAIVTIFVVGAAFFFVTDIEGKLTWDGQASSFSLVSAEEGEYIDDYNFYKYDANYLVSNSQLVDGSADISEPLIDVKWGTYTVDVFVFADEVAGPANIKLQMPYVVPANEMSTIKVQFQLHDGELWSLVQIPFITSDLMQFTETSVTQEAELSGEEEIKWYLASKNYKGRIMDHVAKLWHYKVEFEPSEPDYDVVVHYPMGIWLCVIKITVASAMIVTIIGVIGMFATTDKDIREDMTYDDLYERFTEKSESEDTDDDKGEL